MLMNKFVRLFQINEKKYFFRLLNSTVQTISKENPSNNREKGIVRRFLKDKGYGFIAKTSDGTDCFVHFKNINATGFRTLEQGQEVEFTVVQGEKGVEAKDVDVINSETNHTSSFDNSSKFNFKNRFAFNFDDKRSSKMENFTTNDFLSSNKNQDEKRQIGSVKRWSADRGFGFIRRTNGGPDLFCHVRCLKNNMKMLEEGQTVEYRIEQTEKGEEARDVTIVNDDNELQQDSSISTSPQRQTGVVKRWITEKGYGFVRRDSDDSEVFVHVRSLNDGLTSLEEGQIVEFDLMKTERGDSAKNLSIRNET